MAILNLHAADAETAAVQTSWRAAALAAGLRADAVDNAFACGAAIIQQAAALDTPPSAPLAAVATSAAAEHEWPPSCGAHLLLASSHHSSTRPPLGRAHPRVSGRTRRFQSAPTVQHRLWTGETQDFHREIHFHS